MPAKFTFAVAVLMASTGYHYADFKSTNPLTLKKCQQNVRNLSRMNQFTYKSYKVKLVGKCIKERK